jgi:hypothetical protein
MQNVGVPILAALYENEEPIDNETTAKTCACWVFGATNVESVERIDVGVWNVVFNSRSGEWIWHMLLAESGLEWSDPEDSPHRYAVSISVP